MYETHQKNTDPFFVFKAVEFNNLNHINQLFKNHGEFTLMNFREPHKECQNKYIVIDSAEKLSDIENQEPFKEFLQALITDGWKVIFTVRYSYLDDLKYLLENYIKNISSYNTPLIKKDCLTKLANKYQFQISKNQKLLELLQTPFYLNEYLNMYPEMDRTTNYSKFKEIIWKKKIQNSSYKHSRIHLRREQCFLEIAQKRADQGMFFVKVDNMDNTALQALGNDEILQYNNKAGGYFITHDIYEEWALDRIIEQAFCNKKGYQDFYQKMGSSLPIRRSFRQWISGKLFFNNQDIKQLIEQTVYDIKTESHWQDEILIAVLLSDYCFKFFDLFENEILKEIQNMRTNNTIGSKKSITSHKDTKSLLCKMLFLLRLACKTVDEEQFNLFNLPLQSKTEDYFKTIFTKPKGKGWDCIISFINKHKEEIGLNYINLILPILDEWTQKNKSGKIIKHASQIALFYYKDEGTRYKGEMTKQIIKVILNGSSEIKSELKNIFEEIISKKDIQRSGKYFSLIHYILSSINGSFEIAKHLPKEVLKLADIFWTYIPDEQESKYHWSSRSHNRIDNSEDFLITSEPEFKISSASPLKVPIFLLLRYAYQATIDFILSFINKSIENFAKSSYKETLIEAEVFIDTNLPIKQYINYNLWQAYRGGGHIPGLLQSIHMALEKYFLVYGKNMDSKTLEAKLLYLLKNSKSSSITAVVSSIVLAFPEKTFNIAKILFQTKEFILCDHTRGISEQTGQFNLGFFGQDFEGKFCQKERVESNQLNHRKIYLEVLNLKYQLGCYKTTLSDKEFQSRRTVIWNILDKYYQQLPTSDNETKSDNQWRLCLARMDLRKMKPMVEEKDGKKFTWFKPTIDPKLEKYSEDILKTVNKENKYISLKLWADYKFNNKEEHKKKDYLKYENNPKLVLKETKDIIQKLKNTPPDFIYPFFSKKSSSSKKSQEGGFKQAQGFRIINHSIPLYTCAILIRDYFDRLNQEDKIFCQESIIKCFVYLMQNDNPHQPIGGSEIAIRAFSFLFNLYPEKRSYIKLRLFLFLIKGGDLTKHIIKTVVDMWKNNFDDAHSIFLGYLLLKQKIDTIIIEKQQIAESNFNYNYSKKEVLSSFQKEHQKDIEDVIKNKITFQALPDLRTLDLDTLITAFEMLPLNIENENHKKFVKNIIMIVLDKLFIKNSDQNNDYALKSKFINKFVAIVLRSEIKDIKTYLKPVFDNFEKLRKQEYIEDFFRSFVFATENNLSQYEKFWVVWGLFYPKIVNLCNNQRTLTYYINMDCEIIINYLLADSLWREEVRDWHILKDKEKLFFKKVSKDIGHHPVVLYSILKLLNGIGSKFRDEGILWIGDMVSKQKTYDLFNPLVGLENLESNTVFYMENIIRGYILTHRTKVKKDRQTKKYILDILNFLVEKGSATAYRLREDIL